jgi:hypothetical protein
MYQLRKNVGLAISVALAAAILSCDDSGTGPPPPPSPPAPASNPLDQPLADLGALTISGVSNVGLNARTAALRFQLQGAAFSQSLSDISLTINGKAVPSSALTLMATEIVADVQFDDGKNEVFFKAYDTLGRPLYLNRTLWAGANALTVNLVDANGAPFLQPVTVELQLGDDSSIGASVTTSAGKLTFQNVPSRTVIVTARTPTNLVGVAGGTGGGGAITIRIPGFIPPSTIANNDFALGLAGWNVGSSPAKIVQHVEGFPVGISGELSAFSQDRESIGKAAREANAARLTDAKATTANNDLQLATSGVGEKSVGRSFATSPGVTSVKVRYRFITSEVPGGYFGSRYNDYFSVSLRSRTGGTIANESNTMNGLGLGAFDFSSGATAWRTVTLQTDPKGDVIQLDVAVANVADGLLDSYVVIDFVSEERDKVRPAIAWNNTAGGLNLTYTIEGGDLESAVTIEVYWASGENYASRIGPPFFTHTVPAGTKQGQGGPISIPGASLAANPSGATHLIAASSESQFAVRADVQIVFAATANAAAVSAGMIDVIKDGLRAAGQTSAVITSTARTPADQARAMFQNLVNPANPIATNVANQLALYAAPGDAVINVFTALTGNMTPAQINADAATIQAAMVAEIDRQGPSNVSRHCADPTVVSVVDVGGASFNGSNGPLFRTSVTPRLTRFIDEIATNNAYHLELSR